MQENKLPLKFNFTYESTRLELFWEVLVFYQQCHRALLGMTMIIKIRGKFSFLSATSVWGASNQLDLTQPLLMLLLMLLLMMLLMIMALVVPYELAKLGVRNSGALQQGR